MYTFHYIVSFSVIASTLVCVNFFWYFSEHWHTYFYVQVLMQTGEFFCDINLVQLQNVIIFCRLQSQLGLLVLHCFQDSDFDT